MLPEGTNAPSFELPALVDGQRRRVSLSEYVGDDVVILAFYPADFNPACDAESCDLDELDLFTMQKDVTILGISPDSVYSHRVFAQQYDLKVPLLADTDGAVAAKYDVELTDDIGQHLVERAVAVVGHDGDIQYTWSTEKLTKLPRVDEIKDAIAETGGDDTAFARYRVGHAHYTEARRAFTSAMEGFEQSEWMLAQNDFQQAREEFEEAADRFDTAVRFVDDETLVGVYEDANTKATSLWQAADWLTQAASAYSSGSGAEGQKLRDDAERPLEAARKYAEPPDPDEAWPPAREGLEKDEADDHSILPTQEESADAVLKVDIDEELADIEEIPVEGSETDQSTDEGGEQQADAVNGQATVDTADERAADDTASGEEDIDADELAEIQAELEANNPDEEPTVEEITEESTAIVEAPPMGEREAGNDDSAAADERGDDAVAAASANGANDRTTEASESATEADADEQTDDATAEADDESSREKAKAELEQLQAELGIELPGSDLSESTDEDGSERTERPDGDE